MKKICFMIPSLNSGGSERVFLNLLNNLDRNKYDINLLLINGKGTLYPMLKKDIHIIKLECTRVRFSFFNIVNALKKLKPDIVISTISEFNLFIGFFVIPFLKKYNIYFIGRESHLLSMTYSSKIKKYFKSIALNKFNKIIIQSDDMYKDIQENFNINKSKCIKINNPIDINDIFNKVDNCLKPVEYDDNYKILLCAARLYKQKGLDLLIPIMEQLKNYKVKLYIIGEGPEKENLKNLILEKKIEDRVFFLGRKSNPYIYMKYADLFLLSSRYEGFPNALIEAGSLGLYSICNSCKGGINEIIIDNFNGNIVDYCSVERVKELILKALFEMDINHDKIKEYTIKKYSINSIMALYCDTFNFEKKNKGVEF